MMHGQKNIKLNKNSVSTSQQSLPLQRLAGYCCLGNNRCLM